METYRTVEKETGPELLKEKGSKFISYLYPVESSDQAENLIHNLRKEYHDSTHVCYAYRLGEGEETYFRYNDDGEPNGTAGVPIYNEIKRQELFNVLLAVVRYFGGTKLGTGGLTRAYGGSARMAVDSAKILTKVIATEIEIEIPFSFIGDMMGIINQIGCEIQNQDYAEDGVIMRIVIPRSKLTSFRDVLKDKSAGKIIIPESHSY
ncbi:MAG: YigZ family protein [Acidobacteria bacterium]|nr:YigZ family protein [Acidobacteriota bacterium]